VARYRIIPERSKVWIDARSNVHPIHSGTDGLEGYVELELDSDGGVNLEQDPTGKVSLPVTRLSSGNRMEDREMQKRVEARRYPTIDGVLRRMERVGEDHTYKVSGDVTFRGVERPHQDEMTVEAVDDQTIQLAGKSRFDIREFGMEPPRVLLLKVQPEVDVRVEIVAAKEEKEG
jgi:polyisoprenoid-binding protein YceI